MLPMTLVARQMNCPTEPSTDKQFSWDRPGLNSYQADTDASLVSAAHRTQRPAAMAQMAMARYCSANSLAPSLARPRDAIQLGLFIFIYLFCM